ncbi:beta-ketoacyl synthase chain length factor [uncultured Paraglaciecola sp.]|uniref:beta-ketoacyl synthase chain length factor n=1 Tax=uncultured Paraglaciecola sp. TaxID=1765024 RepID=UPI0030D8DE14|tara:strand:- start:35450 stop:36181 length:732 start_codon:yes stop_codon:yes gene_type:complete
MSLRFNISKCVAWAPGLESEQDWQLWQQGDKPLSDELTLPQLTAIPAMQRRRLSPFAKIALHCALEASGEYQSNIPCVFSSRHGDLHRTTNLIENIALKKDLSPTQFGLSVHNAAAGLFSIFTGNRAPLSAISGGQSSFMQGLLDAVAKLQVNNLSRILYVYCDLNVPECYRPYVVDDTSLAIGLLIEASEDDTNTYSFSYSALENKVESDCQGLDFMGFILSNKSQLLAKIHQQTWLLQRGN